MTIRPQPPTTLQQLGHLADARRRRSAPRSPSGSSGQRDAVDGVLTALLGGGHALLVGVPGLAKTLLVSTIAEALALVVQPGAVHART